MERGTAPGHGIGVVSANTSHCQPGNCQPITIDSATTGTASTADPISRGRSPSSGVSWVGAPTTDA
ncbi:hypothetical protein C1Y40_03394 [Mycobacterium talmoniae]|uniref:Uncharacterized protein n=1 Tax=Mycobacterium talmoniae TaxID=1858794 RepID=A0A2S8BID8_9MYCO|nr:hypothetical protein C1Y40_03394 [Mycobacterium talmoniae]